MRRRQRESNISAFSCKSGFLASSFLRGGRIKTLEACYDNDSSQSDRNTGSWPEAHASLTSYRQDHPPPLLPDPSSSSVDAGPHPRNFATKKISLPVLFWQMFLFDSVKSGGETSADSEAPKYSRNGVRVCVCLLGGGNGGCLRIF